MYIYISTNNNEEDNSVEINKSEIFSFSWVGVGSQIFVTVVGCFSALISFCVILLPKMLWASHCYNSLYNQIKYFKKKKKKVTYKKINTRYLIFFHFLYTFFSFFSFVYRLSYLRAITPGSTYSHCLKEVTSKNHFLMFESPLPLGGILMGLVLVLTPGRLPYWTVPN